MSTTLKRMCEKKEGIACRNCTIWKSVTLHSTGNAKDYETLQGAGLRTVTHLEIAGMAPRFESSVDKLTITMFNREQFQRSLMFKRREASKEAEERN